jgi:hypothetical protein
MTASIPNECFAIWDPTDGRRIASAPPPVLVLRNVLIRARCWPGWGEVAGFDNCSGRIS